MFNGLIEDWYSEELGYNYAEMIMGSQYGFPFVHIECDFKIPSRMGDVIDLTLLVERIGRSSLGVAIVCHRDGVERLRARMVTAMMSIATAQAGAAAAGLRERDRGLSAAHDGLVERRCRSGAARNVGRSNTGLDAATGWPSRLRATAASAA